MDVETEETDQGHKIMINTDRRVALAVKTGSGEKIYLPGVDGDDSTYYAENPIHLRKTENGYYVHHRGRIEQMEVIS